MKKKQKPAKGTYGYLNSIKKNALAHTLLMVAIGLLVFVIGLLLNKMEATNIFTVIAFLFVLPAAKSFVTVVVLLPFKQMDARKKEKLDRYKKGSDEILYDLVFTSSERVMHLDCVYITGSQIIGYTERNKDNVKKIEEYLKKELEIRQLTHHVFLTTNEKQLESRMVLRTGQEQWEKEAMEPVKEMLLLFTI
ncbi:MAG: hypothetical protein E7260_09760 [Lachnospiraceae bacterium]|nr:hypothetical protein [Lachnospiraceae bacterium]